MFLCSQIEATQKPTLQLRLVKTPPITTMTAPLQFYFDTLLPITMAPTLQVVADNARLTAMRPKKKVTFLLQTRTSSYQKRRCRWESEPKDVQGEDRSTNTTKNRKLRIPQRSKTPKQDAAPQPIVRRASQETLLQLR